MQDGDLLYIEDEQHRKLFYHFSPASFISNFVPLIVILDDSGSESLQNFEYKMWNVLTPLGHLGEEETSSCWLGERGDFYLRDLLQKLIAEIADEYECEDHIYLYGKAKSAYGAILHGVLCKANAVYAYAPSIRVEETMASKEDDLTHFLNASDTFPVFYLCDDAIADGGTPQEETAYFSDACRKYDIDVHMDFCAKVEDDTTQHLKAVLDFFERVDSEG